MNDVLALIQRLYGQGAASQKDTLPKTAKRIALKRQDTLFNFLAGLLYAGIGIIIFCALRLFCEQDHCAFFAVIGYGLLIGVAAYAAGLFVGFLFGLPRYASTSDAAHKSYSRNDNLIQISDWLTKIIVGLGLANLYKVPRMLISFGGYASVLFGTTGKNSQGAAMAESILVYFMVSGFLMGYLWTNIHYIPILVAMDGEADNIASEMQAKATAANAVLDARTDSVNASDPQAFQKVEDTQKSTGTQQAGVLTFDQFMQRLKKAKDKMAKGMKDQSYLSDELKDPNKGQWGGKAENNFRKITGSIIDMKNDLFQVTLVVSATSPDHPMTDGAVVLFVLHNTFEDPNKFVIVKNGTATLEFITYGAFTVGILCDDGTTELEYDLMTLPNAPQKFLNS